jgi:hypothetical protein
MPTAIIIVTVAQRSVTVGSAFLIAVLCGTSRIEAKHKTSAKAPTRLIEMRVAMMPNVKS